MSEIEKAFAVQFGLSLNDEVGIFHGSEDPTSFGFDAPIGSLYLRTDGTEFQKTDSSPTDWSLKASKTPVAQTVTVAKSGGDYTTIQGAIDSITDATINKKYTVLVMPGTYIENVRMEEYVSLIAYNKSGTIIQSLGGVTVTAPSGTSSSEIRNFTINNFPSTGTGTANTCLKNAGDGTLSLYDCSIVMAGTANGISGIIFDINAGTINVRGGTFVYTMTGNAVGTVTHNMIDVDGDSVLQFDGGEVIGTIYDLDDNLKAFDLNSSSTAETVLRNVVIILKNEGVTSDGDIECFEITGTVSEIHIQHCYIECEAGGASNICTGAAIQLNSSSGGTKVWSVGNTIEMEGFGGDNDVYKAGVGDLFIIRNDAVKTGDDIFEGGTSHERYDVMPNNRYESSEGTSNTQSTSFQDKQSMTITPNSDSDEVWEIRAVFELKGDTADMILRARLRDITNGDTLNESHVYVTSAMVGAEVTVSSFEQRTISADTPTTFTVQWESDNTSNTASIRRARIIARRIS